MGAADLAVPNNFTEMFICRFRFKSAFYNTSFERKKRRAILSLRGFKVSAWQSARTSCSVSFVDGTKIEADVNKYSFVWKKSTDKYEARLDAKLEKLLPELSSKHGVIAANPNALLVCEQLNHLKS